MLKVLFDEDFRRSIFQGGQRRGPDFDLLRVQDSEVAGKLDPEVLEFAAREN